MKQTPSALKKMLARLANPNPTVALLSLIVEFLGSIVLLAILVDFLGSLSSQIPGRTFAEVVGANTASLMGYLILLIVLVKSIGSDIYDLVWPEEDQNEIDLIHIDEQGLVYFLRGIKETYLRNLHEVGREQLPSVRLNIMMPQTHANQKEEVLRIVLAAYLDDYNEHELLDTWYLGQGKCGLAWEQKRQEVYASDVRSEDTVFEAMGEKTSEAKLLESVLSTPVIWKNEVIAVLNIDSYQGGNTTLMHTTGMRVIFADAAREIAPLLASSSLKRG